VCQQFRDLNHIKAIVAKLATEVVIAGAKYVNIKIIMDIAT
jgi:hypothetical protein